MLDWLDHSQYLIAFITGLLGGVHCLGMCGGIVGALTLNTSQSTENKSTHSSFVILIGYNIGRIMGYMLAGAFVAFFSSSLVDLTGIQNTKQILSVLASIIMIALGLYLAGIWNDGIEKLESVGSVVWKRIQPFTKYFMPVHSFQQAVPLGFLWGWLPCGLVYTALIWTLSASSAVEGALIMAVFGIGTLPNLLVMGVLATNLSRWVKSPLVRLIAGSLVITLGFLTLARAFS